MKHKNGLPGRIRRFGFIGLFLLTGSVFGWPQAADAPAAQPSDAMTNAVRELQEEVRELRTAVVELRSEAGQYRAETEQLRRELQAAHTPGTPPEPSADSSTTAGVPSPLPAAPLEDRVASLEESTQLLSSKVDDQYQTKIEAASKYRIRLSGIMLFNLFANRGNIDNQDFPTWAIPSFTGSTSQTLGASLRQSEIGLEVFGPRLAGAKTTGNLQVDFSGGFANTPDGVNFGVVRLRIATLRMDWNNTSLVAGQDNAFVSPLSPTSFASLAVPAFGYAGNLWGWIPQVRVEHRIDLSNGQKILLQGGIMDNVTGELPAVELRAFGASWRKFRPAGLRGASGLDSQRFRQAADFRRGRLLQPADLGLQQSCGWLGGNDGLEHSTDKSRHSDRGVLSRPSRGLLWAGEWGEACSLPAILIPTLSCSP